MTRLKKELIERGIVYESDNPDYYDEARTLIAVTDKYIVTLWGCNVLPSEIHLFDRNFNPIGSQNLFPEEGFFRSTKLWNSFIWD